MAKSLSKGENGLRDEREPLAIYLYSELFLELKMAALQADTSASALTEKEIVTLLKSHRPKN